LSTPLSLRFSLCSSFFIAFVAAPSAARANVARSETDGDRFGALIARDEAILVVDSEQLRFDIAEDLARARVTATYHFRNPQPHAQLANACFVYVAGDAPSADPPSITIDGAPVDYRPARDVDEFRPRLPAWSSLRLAGLVFAIATDPGASRTVVVTYTHVAGEDRAKRVAPTYSFHYLLTPAKTWKAFGPLTIDVALPHRDAWAESSLPWRPTATGYRIDLDGLPSEELVFELMPKARLWFGMTGHAGYWAIVLGAIAAVTLAIGRAVAKVGHRLARVLLAGAAALAASVVIVSIHAALAPPYALGFGYDPILGVLAAIASAVLCAMIVGGRQRQRRS
jgi:hypothetical protein